MTLRGASGRGEEPIVDGAQVSRIECIAVKCDSDMTVTTVVYADGTTQSNVPLFRGYNPIGVRSLTGISTGHAWAVYV